MQHYGVTVSEEQDLGNHYTKPDYMEYIKGYYGSTYGQAFENDYLTASQTFEELFALSEWYIYGSSRLGSEKMSHWMRKKSFDASFNFVTGSFTNVTPHYDSLYQKPLNYIERIRGEKNYELSNHLGNVLAVISDQWISHCDQINFAAEHYEAVLVQATDYSAFGAPLPGRSWVTPFGGVGAYRYGFNGKETDGETSLQDYGFRIYNPGLGKFLSVDPLTRDYPWYTPYQFAGNKPIQAIDIDGLEEYFVNIYQDEQGNTTKITIWYYVDVENNVRDNDLKKQSDGSDVTEKKVQVNTHHSDGSITTNFADDLDAEQKEILEDAPEIERNVSPEGEAASNKFVKGKEYTDGKKIVKSREYLNIKFQSNSDKPASETQAVEAAKSVAGKLNKNPNLKITLVGNAATNGTLSGNIYGKGSNVYKEKATLNGKTSTVGNLMTARAETMKRILIDAYKIDPSRVKTEKGLKGKNGDAGRSVGVKYSKD